MRQSIFFVSVCYLRAESYMKATPLLSSLFICGVSRLAHLIVNCLLVLGRCGEKSSIDWHSNDATCLLRPCKRNGEKGIVVYYNKVFEVSLFRANKLRAKRYSLRWTIIHSQTRVYGLEGVCVLQPFGYIFVRLKSPFSEVKNRFYLLVCQQTVGNLSVQCRL